MKYLVKYTPAFLLFIYVLVFLTISHPRQPWGRPISSDGKGYYAYLPALFIYHDPDFRFVEHYENLYYGGDIARFKEFRIHVKDGVVNKYYPGLAVLWLPFFLLAHLISHILGFPTDGYSIIYQYAVAAAALFYLWLGLFFLMKLLKNLGASAGIAAFTTMLIALGTNLMFFVIVEDSMSHVYSFAMITLFLYSIVRFRETGPAWIILSMALFALICIIRPVNGLIILLVPFIYMLCPGKHYHVRFDIGLIRNLVEGGIVSLLIFSIPLLYWLHQTGHPFVYTYGSETFNFHNQRFFSILFSYNRGWFIYTPVAFLSLGGLAGIFRENKKAFSLLLIFLIIFIYVASSWWMWYYTSKCGQRIFIDIYAVTAIMMFRLIITLKNNARLTSFLSGLLILLAGLNIFQFFQHERFVFPATYITREIYWDSFFSLYPKSRVYLPENSVQAIKTAYTDMEHPVGWMNEFTLSNAQSYSGKMASCINKGQPYSLGLDHSFAYDLLSSNRVVKISAMLFSKHSKTAASLVADFRENGKSISYNAFYLNTFVIPDRWTKVESGIQLPRNLQQDGHLLIYFYNPTDTSLFVDDLKIEFMTLYDIPDLQKIEGVLLPCR